VRRFFGKPKKNDVLFLKTEILDVTFGEKPENRKKRKTGGKREKTKKNRYFSEIEPYLYEFDAIESRFGIYTRKTEESLFEI
jgi:hypothetical protein